MTYVKTGKKETISVIISLDSPTINKDNTKEIDLLMEQNILPQTLDKKQIDIVFISFLPKEECEFLKKYDQYGYRNVSVFNTTDRTLNRLDLVKAQLNTTFFTIKTIAYDIVNDKPLSCNVEWLPNHLELSVTTLEKEKTLYSIAVLEYVDVDTYGIKDPPDLILLRTPDQINQDTILIDEVVFAVKADFSFHEGSTKNDKGLLVFKIALIVEKLFRMVGKGSFIDGECSIRQYIKKNSFKKNLRIVVEGNTIKAI